MRHRPFLAIFVLTAGWAGWFGLSVWQRHIHLFSSQFDLGIMDQVLWQTIHGHFFQMTSPVLGVLQSRAAIHGDLFLVALTPFYALWSDPRTLVLIQVVALASGTFPLWLLARRRVPEIWAVVVAGLYLVQPGLAWTALFDLHAVVFATPLLLWAVWAATTRRWVWMWIFFFSALTTKEEVGLVVAMTALILGWKKILTWRQAATLGVTSLTWVAIMTAVVLPHYADNDAHFAISYFAEYGQSVPEIFLGILRHPIIFTRDLLTPITIGYVTIMTGATALVAWRKPVWLVAAAPTFVMNMISNDPHMQTLYYQYTATITPFVMLAMIDGLDSLTKLRQHPFAKIWILVWVGVMVWLWVPLPGMRHHHDAVRVFTKNPYEETVRRLARDIPANLPLAVSNDLGPQFSRRDRVWVFPNALDRADAVVVLLGRERDVLPQDELVEQVEQLKQSAEWRLVQVENDQLFYFRRVNNR